jgi:hypothetical protein
MPGRKRQQKRARVTSDDEAMAKRIAAIDRLYGFFPKPRRTASIADMQRAIEEGAAERSAKSRKR